MTPIHIRGITKRFGSTIALDDVCIDIAQGEIFFLLGPSGCGKTTLLRIVAGLETADSGSVMFGDTDVTHMAARHREAVMVFQSYALWPHMTVEKNVEFGLDVRGMPGPRRREAVRAALEQVRLVDLAQRKPGQLSGGQQQRVALARALVVRPRVLLLDEPLSNLDAGLRMQMRSDIRRLCSEAGLTALYVTHDQHEAMAVADRIALMRDGVVEQVGTPTRIYRQPASRFAALFMGETNLFEATVEEAPGGLVLTSSHGPLGSHPLHEGSGPGDRVICSVRPESFVIDPDDGPGVTGHVLEATFLGERTEYVVQTDGGPLKVWDTRSASQILGKGDALTLGVRPGCLVVLPSEKGER